MLDSHRLALATAVATGTARLLATDNTAGPTLPIADAVTTGGAFFVTPHPRLLVVDADPTDRPHRAADVAAALDLLLEAADRAGVPALAVESGRPGHRHAYLVTGTGTARAALERWCERSGLDVRTRGIRPPGTPHRTLPTTAWCDHLTVDHALATLTSPPDPAATARLAADLCPLTLPARVMTAVRKGHTAAGYATPSHARMALAVAVRARGGSPGLLRAILEDRTSPLGATYRSRPEQWRAAERARLWDKAGTWITTSDLVDHRDVIDQVAAAAASAAWPGKGGASDLAVLEELLRVAARVGTSTPAAALGDLAVGAGVSRDTARAAVRRLHRAGWVRIAAPATPTCATTYQLTVPTGTHTPTGPHTAQIPPRDTVGDLGHDAARWAALGKSTTRVLRHLGTTPVTVADLATQVSMSAASVRHHLRKLAAHQLAARTGTGWVRQVPVDLVQVAHRCGVAGARARQARELAAYRDLRRAARASARARMHVPAGAHATPLLPLP
jgi:hypothetical protein